MTDPLPKLPARRPDSHKGDFGTALLIGGSRDMPGAIALCGMGALRSGAGLVRLAVPSACHSIVASFEPSYMTAALACDADGRISAAARDRLMELVAHSTAVAIGPGMGRSKELDELVADLYMHVALPMIVDADALNALSGKPAALEKPGGPRILTPHPGEFARLAGVTTAEVQAKRQTLAETFAAWSHAIVVLKGYKTLITDGKKTAVNETGNPGMATGGTGDVLTGVITALVCQKLAPFDAAHLGVHVHGLAADRVSAERGTHGMIARDIAEFLPEAFLHVKRSPA
ncbi:MAG: NAD(P)H-hydrate dehydratase [Planctomycetia bacterium]|nr:NAD(P)H-hydrate dehydratase [Planctomycetia bacterium]